MTENSNPQNRIKNYGLERPTAVYALSSLQRFLGEDQALELWQRVCANCQIDTDEEELDHLEEAFKQLSKESGAVGVLGRSLVIRTVSYRTLSRRNQ